MAQDRTELTTTRRLLTFIAKHPNGVPRSRLHAVTGDIEQVHHILDKLLSDGRVKLLVFRNIRGKPQRRYVLAEHYRPEMEEPVPEPEPLPTIDKLVLDVIVRYQGLARSDVWSHAQLNKHWVAQALDHLVRDGRVVEVLETDARGGQRRRYATPDHVAFPPDDDAQSQPQPHERPLAQVS